MNKPDQSDQDAVRENVSRTVGLTVLRRLSKVAEEEAALEKVKRLWVRRAVGTFVAIAVVVLFLVIASPETLRNLFRDIAGMIR